MINIKKFIYKVRLFLSRFKKYEHQNDNFIYEQDDDE